MTEPAAPALRPAVFLDRDGVLNELVLNPKTSQFESPHALGDLHLIPGAIEALRQLQEKFLLFVVTNQPSHAKGKVSLEVLQDIHLAFALELERNSVRVQEYYYCFHHPEAVLAEWKVRCECRKPGSLFLRQAGADFGLDWACSWMVGDRDSDIQCGQSMGCQTALIENPHSRANRGKSQPTLTALNLLEASQHILKSFAK